MVRYHCPRGEDAEGGAAARAVGHGEPTHVLSDGRSHLTRRRPEHRTQEDLDPREHLAEASERLSVAMGALGSPLYAVSARADARAEIDAVILILVRQLRLAQWPPPWERIGGGR
jgi:hypothetical protein